MSHTCYTLAALTVSALPSREIIATAQLDEPGSNTAQALLSCADGEELLVYAPRNAAAAAELRRHAHNLRAFSAGLRSRLPFAIPQLLAEKQTAGVPSGEESFILVLENLPGYTLEAEVMPPGEGAATSVGGAIASLHDLPLSVIAAAGFKLMTAQQCQLETQQLVERAAATRLLPLSLRESWRDLSADASIWQFRPTVINGECSATSFRFGNTETGEPTVRGFTGWQGLRVGDPAQDLRWLNEVQASTAESVLRAYSLIGIGQHDEHRNQRARLYAELELARWMLQGVEVNDQETIDAAALALEQLAESLNLPMPTIRAAAREAEPDGDLLAESRNTTPQQALSRVQELVDEIPRSPAGDQALRLAESAAGQEVDIEEPASADVMAAENELADRFYGENNGQQPENSMALFPSESDQEEARNRFQF